MSDGATCCRCGRDSLPVVPGLTLTAVAHVSKGMPGPCLDSDPYKPLHDEEGATRWGIAYIASQTTQLKDPHTATKTWQLLNLWELDL